MRFLVGMLAVGAFIAEPAMAAQMARECSSPAEQSAFEVEALKSELMVITMSCQHDAQYNAFINRYKPQLLSSEAEFSNYFKHAYGKRSQAEHDAYVTALANAQSDLGTKLGSDFCPRNSAMFAEVMALHSGADLPEYVAAKDLIPASLGACAQAPVVNASSHTKATRHTTSKKRS